MTVLNQDSNVINAADWVSLDESNILINPKCDLVINITSIEFTFKVNILPSLSDSFKLTVSQNNEIWNKDNVSIFFSSWLYFLMQSAYLINNLLELWQKDLHLKIN